MVRILKENHPRTYLAGLFILMSLIGLILFVLSKTIYPTKVPSGYKASFEDHRSVSDYTKDSAGITRFVGDVSFEASAGNSAPMIRLVEDLGGTDIYIEKADIRQTVKYDIKGLKPGWRKADGYTAARYYQLSDDTDISTSCLEAECAKLKFNKYKRTVLDVMPYLRQHLRN